MTDKHSAKNSSEKRKFNSKLNPESAPFQPSSTYRHVQEISKENLSPSTNDNQTDNSHDELVEVEYQNHSLRTIHQVESIKENPSYTCFIEETKSDNEYQSKPSDFQTETDLTSEHNDNHTNFNDEKTQRQLDEDEIPSIDMRVPHISNHINNDEENSNNNASDSNIDVPVTQIEPDDVLGNKSLLKQTITPGILDTRPSRNTIVTVSYKLFLIDSSTSESRPIETIKNEMFYVGEYDVLPAIDICIQLMDRGEHALIDSDPRHCYGDTGCEEKQIPPLSSENSYRMKIDIELHDWKYAPDIQTLSINERLFWGDKKRHTGNFSYRRKDYSTALQCYRNASKFLDINETPLLETDEQNIDSTAIIDRYIQVQNNLAQVYLLNNQYNQCLNVVNDVLKYDSNNIKALFRQAKAYYELGYYEEAVKPLRLLLKSESKDVEKDKVNAMLNFCETKLAKYKKNEKEIYTKMFQPMTASAVEKPQSKENIEKIDHKQQGQNWWPYFAMGGAVVVAVGIAAIIKYR